jgi:hypothetical protein
MTGDDEGAVVEIGQSCVEDIEPVPESRRVRFR